MNNKVNYREILLRKIHKFLEDKNTLPQFQDEYYDYFLKEIPDRTLTDSELLFFGTLQEQLDWTVENPGEDRKWGYRNYQEYKKWAEQMTKAFLENEKKWEENYHRHMNSW